MKENKSKEQPQSQENTEVLSAANIVRRDLCEHCGKPLQETCPPPEDWGIHRFCLKIFSWRLMLVKHEPEYSCVECIADEQQARESEHFHDAVAWAISEEIQKGNLIPREYL